ncbi:MAG TPA: hypothetical protein PLT36_07815 [Erysipelotrichaceae bacterium]|nr:hypothetical protein [Erysipelotrichaceae bacterium]
MRKFLIILLLLFCFSLAACKDDDTKKQIDDKTQETDTPDDAVIDDKEDIIDNNGDTTTNDKEDEVDPPSGDEDLEEEPADRALDIKAIIEMMEAAEDSEVVIRVLFKVKAEIKDWSLEELAKITNLDRVELLITSAICKLTEEKQIKKYVGEPSGYYTFEELFARYYPPADAIEEVGYYGFTDSIPCLKTSVEAAYRIFYLPFIEVEDVAGLMEFGLLFENDEFGLPAYIMVRRKDNHIHKTIYNRLYFYSNGICMLRTRESEDAPEEVYVSIIGMDLEVFAEESYVPFERFFPSVEVDQGARAARIVRDIENLQTEENPIVLIRKLFKLKDEIANYLPLEYHDKITNLDQIEVLMKVAIAKRIEDTELTGYVINSEEYFTFEDLLIKKYRSLDFIQQVDFYNLFDEEQPALSKRPENACKMLNLPFIEVQADSVLGEWALGENTSLFETNEYMWGSKIKLVGKNPERDLNLNFEFRFVASGVCVLKMKVGNDPWEAYVSIVPIDPFIFSLYSDKPLDSFFPQG